jgi:hypothetical protein
VFRSILQTSARKASAIDVGDELAEVLVDSPILYPSLRVEWARKEEGKGDWRLQRV